MSVASKNLYDLLGNDDESDQPRPPVKTVDKTTTRTVKRNADGEAPATKAPAGQGRRGGFGGNEAAFRDRNAGSDRNRGKTTDDAPRGGQARGGRDARVRGGRGGRFPRERDDRHSKSVPTGGSDKQAAQGWGATEGDAELKDEQAGEEIAQSERKDAATEEAGDETPAEPEEKHISYADYLAQQAEKKLALEGDLKVRQANEGAKNNKQWATAKELVKDEDDDFISASAGKTKRERERKTKQVVDIDQRYVEPERPTRGGRGGRGGSRGDSGRGGPRGGDSSRGGPRGGRGAPRGGDFPRGGGRGGREASNLNTNDEKAFPSLGGK
ncbi:uncharacterized protein E0L32_005747 [Thyridium curvatum]|uniref:Hyaluronan/mRNA-binding protein domain-containing protein n=1 Tax=Thyridium curvatum TaxID=1093900 RepID=A0A507B1P7_9PEZI|nr:uncharacterized protein E0L32_005747 [Thyridium curvatum]TPX13803.1 hypothetical protein E0L32_005747 [Thyridium curvatum]